MPYKNDLTDFIVYSHTCFYYPRITSRGWQRPRPSPRLKPLARLSAVDTSGNAVCPGGFSYVSLHLQVKAWRGIKVVQDGRICIKDCSILEIGRQEDERQSLNRCSRKPGERWGGIPSTSKGVLRFYVMFPGRIKDNKNPLSGRTGLLEMWIP